MVGSKVHLVGLIFPKNTYLTHLLYLTLEGRYWFFISSVSDNWTEFLASRKRVNRLYLSSRSYSNFSFKISSSFWRRYSSYSCFLRLIYINGLLILSFWQFWFSWWWYIWNWKKRLFLSFVFWAWIFGFWEFFGSRICYRILCDAHWCIYGTTSPWPPE